MRYYRLPLLTGEARDDRGAPIWWAACPALPGAYEEGSTLAEARERLAELARRIIAEHLLRDDPLEPEIDVSAIPGADRESILGVGVGEADLAAARAVPLLVIEQPEP